MNIRDFVAESDYIVLDGAIGTQIYARGIPRGHCYDEINISMPDVIIAIHEEYLKAGARIITSNTFGANRLILEEYFDLGEKTKEINYYGARLAKRAAKDKAFVAGSMGPASRPLDRDKTLDRDQAASLFKEQAEALLEGGVDMILLESFADPDELLAGIEAVKSIKPDLYVLASMSFPGRGGLTLYGRNPYEIAPRLDSSAADVIGTNCGAGPQSVLEAVRKMGQVTSKDLLARPNAGLAQFVRGKFLYPANPDYFALSGRRFLEAGVKLIGGCCGTTPAHIEALFKTLEGLKPGPRKRLSISISRHREKRLPEHITSPLLPLLQKGSLIALSVDPPRDPHLDRLADSIKPYSSSIHVLSVTDSPLARPRMSSIAAGKLLKDKLGLDIIIHYTCRDRNILGIQSDLLGAAALGLENILALGGNPPSVGDYPFATGVYDLTSEGLVSLISSLNQGVDLLGNPLGRQTRFLTGVGAGIDTEPKKLMEEIGSKAARGAHFVVTLPVFALEKAARSLEALKELGLPVIVGVLPLVSGQQAEYVHFEVPGISIPQKYLKRMEGLDGPEGEKEGIRIAREIIDRVRPLAAGILLNPPEGRLHILEHIL